MQHPVLAPTAAGCPCAGTVPWPPSWDGRSLCKTRRFPRQERVDGLKMSSSILAALESRAVTLPKHPGSDVREPEAVLPEPRQTPARQRWLWGRYRTCATVCQSHGRSHSTHQGLHPRRPHLSRGTWARWHPWHSWRKGADSIIGTAWCQICPACWCRQACRMHFVCQESQAVLIYSSFPAATLFSPSRTLTSPLKFKISLKPSIPSAM